jgi:small subunit ribosomal protein S18
VAKQRNRKPVRRREKRGAAGTGRRKPCPYCKDKIEQVDYKDVEALKRFVSEKGKMRRELALLPYVSESAGGDDRPRGRGPGRDDR